MLLYAGKKQSHPQKLADNLIIMIRNTWDFCLMKYTTHSCVFQSQFRSSFCLARNWLGLDPLVMLIHSKRDLLDMWFLPMGVASPSWIGRCIRGLTFPHGFIFSEFSEKPPNLPHLKTCWVIIISLVWLSGYNISPLSGNHRWYVMLPVDALTFSP